MTGSAIDRMFSGRARPKWRTMAQVALLVAVGAGGDRTDAAGQDQGAAGFSSYINGRWPLESHTTGFFLGTFADAAAVAEFQAALRRGGDGVFDAWSVSNPFTGQSFSDYVVFGSGRENRFEEIGIRVPADHLDLDAFPNRERRNHELEVAVCHSNGCVRLFRGIEAGEIRVETVIALGTDWTTQTFDPGALGGTEVFFFRMKGDPIPRIPAFRWTRVTDTAPGFRTSIHYSEPRSALREIAGGLARLVTGRRPVADGLHVIDLEPPEGVELLERHDKQSSYLRALGTLAQRRALPTALAGRMAEVYGSCPDDVCAAVAGPRTGSDLPGGGPGGPGLGEQGPGAGPRPGPDLSPRLNPTPGGVRADIRIRPEDFGLPCGGEPWARPRRDETSSARQPCCPPAQDSSAAPDSVRRDPSSPKRTRRCRPTSRSPSPR